MPLAGRGLEERMNTTPFTAVTRSLISLPSRRHILRSLAGAGLGLGSARLPDFVEANKKRKRKKKNKKAKPNEFGCLSVDKTCKNSKQCCSGICEGKKGKRTCRAHGTGTCDQKAPGICTAPNPLLTRCNNSDQCACIRTTAGSNFCYDQDADAGSDCADCQQDADCEALGFPPGTACAPVFAGACSGACETGMYCVVPCGTEPPVPEQLGNPE
jgi:hypothetical protein